ncbi:MAG TPA: glycerol kinase GlpK [Solirubrobacteraceae bacterium]|jgi:glycerol kinase|nr:glycerol kinase GlpK [Solirubrobacteraceae bacterium]
MIVAIDQGTTGTSCLVFDERAEPLGRAYREFEQRFPRPGWVEHDAEEIWQVTHAVVGEALADARARVGDVSALGIANQRETVCVWDPVSGEPLHAAIVWQDRRTAARCERLREDGCEPLVRARTGLVLDPYFSASKIEWLLEHVDGLRERARTGRAVFGTVDSWLLFKLTGEHATDATNASRTLLYDIAAGHWDAELLELFDVPERALPRVLPSAGDFGVTRPEALHGHAIPVTGVAGDQQAALFGHACVDPGMGKNTYGTGSFVLVNTGFDAPKAPPGLLATVACAVGSARVYALEASIFVTGAAVQWLRDGLRIIEHVEESERLARELDGNGGVYFVPALTGLGSPHWDAHARGTIVGLTRGSGRAQLARAALEAIAYQTVDAVRAIESASGEPLAELRADGGASANAWLMQFQADVLGVPVVLGRLAQTTALGAAYLAGVGAGEWTLSDVRDEHARLAAGELTRYEPRIGEDQREALLAGWNDALARARSRA